MEKDSKSLKKVLPPRTVEKGYNLQAASEKKKGVYAPWTDEDDKMLMELFNDGKLILVKVFERTTGGIIARIKKLNMEMD